jgi:hypothetical protein
MEITIPQNVMYEGKAFEVARKDNVRFDVGNANSLTAKRNEEDRLGDKWLSGPLNGPKLVEVKDFEGVGIVQITTESVEEIGADGVYHWSGEEITYAKLMAEARKLGAHAVINIVVDHRDAVTETTDRRHVEAGYKLSAEDQNLNKKVKDRLTLDIANDGTTTLIDKTHRTVRTWTGTALAIKYAQPGTPQEK